MRVVALTALVPVLLLSGCIFADRAETTDALAISDSGGSLVIAICEEIEFDLLSVSTRAGDDPWVELPDYRGPLISVNAGDVISVDTASEIGLSEWLSTDDVQPGDLVELLIRNRADVWNTTFLVPEDGLRESSWVLYDDSVSPEPCPG
jgi:hypothetical protein